MITSTPMNREEMTDLELATILKNMKAPEVETEQ
jgi:hypothetical protein